MTLKKIFITLSLFLIFSSSDLAKTVFCKNQPEPLNLSDCYSLALKQSETIAINSETIKEAEAHFIQAMSGVLPHVSYVLTDYRRDKVGASYLYPDRDDEQKFNFTQNLFSGFKEFIAMSGSKSEELQRKNELERARQLLFVDVADAFYLLKEIKEDLKSIEITRQALIDRINELSQREELGRSRKSEVVNAQAQLYSVESEIELIKGREVVARDLLEFLVGQPVGEVVDSAFMAYSVDSENSYVSKFVLRPDVKAARQAWDVARKKAAAAKSDLLPTVSLEGNYYTARTAAPEDRKWEGLLKVDIPIFEGGRTYGNIKEANALARISELEFRRSQRMAVQDIEDSYIKLKTAISGRKALKKALIYARMNYVLQKKDYRLNLVSNLDVLQAIQGLGDMRRSYIRAFYENKRLYWQLCAAAGEATMERLNDTIGSID